MNEAKPDVATHATAADTMNPSRKQQPDHRTGLTPRLRLLQRDGGLSSEQAEIFDRVTRTRKSLAQGSDGLPGPWNAMLYSTQIGSLMERMGDVCRNTATYKAHPGLIEIGICMVGVEWVSQFEVYAHLAMARESGVSEQMLNALLEKNPASQVHTMTAATEAERAVYAFGRELLDNKRVSDECYAAVHAHIGDQGIVELVHTMGHYVNVSMSLNCFNVPLPKGKELPFAEPKL
jgi:4-carboxymuconolactone decarboxylase